MFSVKDILSLESLRGLPDNASVSGLVLIKDCKKKVTKNGGYFLDGIVEGLGSYPFKVWGSSDAFASMEESDYTGCIAYVEGKSNKFGGVDSLIISSVRAVEEAGCGLSKKDFFYSKYNGKEYYKGLRNTLLQMTNSDILEVFDLLMKGREERFYEEFAAKGNHDNCRSGLVAHTYKVLYISKILKLYPNLQKFVGNYNLLYLGAAIHDIGKIVEYTDGTIQGIGRLCSHHTFGVEMLFENKSAIVGKFGEEFFYRLCSIVEQHHGEFEERPRTVEAYVVYLVDRFESSMKFLDQSLEGLSNGDQINIGEFKLS